jgi:hypothetical protein
MRRMVGLISGNVWYKLCASGAESKRRRKKKRDIKKLIKVAKPTFKPSKVRDLVKSSCGKKLPFAFGENKTSKSTYIG